jgi:hypothetical protein
MKSEYTLCSLFLTVTESKVHVLVLSTLLLKLYIMPPAIYHYQTSHIQIYQKIENIHDNEETTIYIQY